MHIGKSPIKSPNSKCFLDKNIADEAEKTSAKESSVDQQQLPNNPTPDLLATPPVEPIPAETPRTLGGMCTVN